MKETDALGQETTYLNDLAGQVKQKTDRNGITTHYAYNGRGDLLGQSVTADGETLALTNTYGKSGLLRQTADNAGTTSYTYNALGQLTEEETGNIINTYSYDIYGNRTGFTLVNAGQAVLQNSYAYDNLNRLTGVTNAGETTTYTYNANGNVTSEQVGSSRTTYYGYNMAGLLTYKENYAGNSQLEFVNKPYETNISKAVKRQQVIELKISQIMVSQTSSEEKIMEVLRWRLGQLTEDEKSLIDEMVKSQQDISLLAIKQGANFYIYCINNPIRHFDPSGLAVYFADANAAAGLGIYISANAMLVWDDEGNMGIMVGGGIGGGVGVGWGAGIGMYKNMNNIYQLQGMSVSAGVAAYLGFEYQGASGADGFATTYGVGFYGTVNYGWMLFSWRMW